MPIVDAEMVFKPIVRRCIAASLILFACVIVYWIAAPQGLEEKQSHDFSSVNWKPYSPDAKNFNLKLGRNVLVFVYAEAAAESEILLREFDASKVFAACGGEVCETLLLRYDNWDDPNIRSVWADVGHTKYPMIVLYSPSRAPVRVY
jgi:hypothetical protein